MANLKEIKSHIKSVSDTQKITNAMYLIASTKMRSAKSLYTAHIPYFNMLEAEIKRISSGINEKECPYIAQKQGTVAVLIIASDKGMCGDYNKSVIKAAEETIKNIDHVDFPACVDVLMMKILRSNEQVTVDTFPEYPQFLLYTGETSFRAGDGRIVPLTSDNGNTQEKYSEDKESAFIEWIKSLIAVVLDFFKDIFGKIKALFS